MPATRPRDLPGLRLELLKLWALDGIFTEFAVTSFTDPRFTDDPTYGHLEAHFDKEVLRQGVLWWVDADMCDLVAHAAPSLPPTTLTEDLVPRHPVVAYFEKPMAGSDAMLDGIPSPVQMLGWAPKNKLMGAPEPLLTMTMYGPPVIDTDLDLWPLGRTDWAYGTDTDVATFPSKDDADDKRREESMAEDRRLLAALLLLASQPLASRETVRPMNKARLRKLTATGLSPDVTVVGLRRPEASGEAAEAGSGRRWGHRTIVGAETGGFWRQQAYGPEWSLRRPRWILPFEAGPADGPLIVKPKVKVVRGGDKPEAP